MFWACEGREPHEDVLACSYRQRGKGVLGGLGLITYLRDGFKSRFPVTIQSVLNYASYDPAKDARAKRCWLPNDADFAGFASNLQNAKENSQR